MNAFPPPPPPPPPEDSNAETLIAACTAMLSHRRFSTARDFALRLPPSHHTVAHKIIAISDVLSAAHSRDWYSLLQLSSSDFAGDLSLPRQQFKKLALLLDTNTNTFPLSDEALTCLAEAWHILADPQRRQIYDLEIASELLSQQQPQPQQPPTQQPQPQQQPPLMWDTFWTVCPYCWKMYLYEKAYEDCALRCEGCQKVFQGVPVKPPVREETAVVQGERREYYKCNASVPLRYYEVLEKPENKNLNEENFVYISDDDEDNVFGKGNDVGNDGMVLQGNVNNGRVDLRWNSYNNIGNNNNGKGSMRVKTVAKKMVGNRMMRKQQGVFLDADNDLGLNMDAGDDSGELEFTQGDDGDIFVGVRFGD
ncbi:hypothetical protein AAHE18_15G000500 [Arachis hypogaea]|nr:uncharacterized protein DS421_5g170510 [Arachis hypogaea]